MTTTRTRAISVVLAVAAFCGVAAALGHHGAGLEDIARAVDAGATDVLRRSPHAWG